MKSKKTEKEREFKELNLLVSRLKQDITLIIDKHNSYQMSPDDNSDWFERLPIESLSELLDSERGRHKRFTLKDMSEKQKLRLLHRRKVEELEIVKSKIFITEIDLILESINRLL